MDDYQWYKRRQEDGFIPLNKIRNFYTLRAIIDERLYSGTTFGTNIVVEHWVKIFLHTLICALIYLALGHNQVSFGASMLYSCNPINNQTSMWLNGRRYSINIVLILLMILIPIASPFLYLLTAFLQVSAFFSPILLMNKSPLFLLMIPTFIILGYNKIKAKVDTRTNDMADGDLKKFSPPRVIVIVKTYGLFFFKMLFPGVCAMQYPDRIKWGLTREGTQDSYKIDIHFIRGLFAIFICIVIMFLVPYQLRILASFMALATLQWSAILPVTQILSDRYCSMPNVFMMFFVSYFAHSLGIFYIPLMIGLGAYYCICLSVIYPMYKNLTDFYIYHFRYFPELSWYRHNLIRDLMAEGKIEMASAQAFQGLIYDKKDFRLLMWGAIMSMLKADIFHAEEFLKEAEKNTYINKEFDNQKEVDDLRNQINALKPIEKKKERLTPREKVIFMNRRMPKK